MRSVAGFVIAVALPLAAWAGKVEDESAKEHYEKAQIHYKLGEFEQALVQYRETYRFKPLAALLFNIAQCYRQLNNPERARFYYRNYLNDAKSPPNRVEVEKLIEDMTQMMADKEKAAAPAPAPVAAAPAPAPAPAAPPAAPAPAAAAAAPEKPAVAAPPPAAPEKPAAVAATPPPSAKPAAAPPAPKPSATPAAKPAAPAAAVTASAPKPDEKGFPILGAVGGGAALALGAGAGYFLAQALGTEASLLQEPHERAEIVTLRDQAGTNRTIALGLAAGAGVALAVGVVGFVF
jgi:tetratricopeptide (TPR) repeat protein